MVGGGPDGPPPWGSSGGGGARGAVRSLRAAFADRRQCRTMACFWALGLLNNSAYVICLALATGAAGRGCWGAAAWQQTKRATPKRLAPSANAHSSRLRKPYAEISSGGVGLVYLAAIAPTILVKATVSLVRCRCKQPATDYRILHWRQCAFLICPLRRASAAG